MTIDKLAGGSGWSLPNLLAVLRKISPPHQDAAIASSRLLLAAVALGAVFFDPTQPTRFSHATYFILVIFAAWSLALALLSWTVPLASRYHFLTHILDICVFIALTYLTEGPSSPFFVFFTYSIVSAGLRWGARGAVSTATVVLAAFLALTLFASTTEDGDVTRVVVRAAYLVVIAVLIGLFGWYRQSASEQLRRLSEWPIVAGNLGDEQPISTSLEHAALVLGIERLTVVWREDDGGVWRLAEWNGRSCDFSEWVGQEPPLVAPIGDVESGLTPSSEMMTKLGHQQVMVAPFSVAHHSGAVIIVDPPRQTTELQRLADIISRRVAIELEQARLRRDLAQATISRERERLARDMHDGILQDLAAVGLHLETIARHTPEPHLETVRSLSALVREQQARIRSFVDFMNPKMRHSRTLPLLTALERSTDTLQRQWQLRLSFAVVPPDTQVTESQDFHLRSLLAEATANAVRHGGATELLIGVDVSDRIRVSVADNGHPAAPVLSAVPGASTPASLEQRIADLGGAYDFSAGSEGGRLIFSLPRNF